MKDEQIFRKPNTKRLLWVPSKKMFDAYVTFLEKKHKGKLIDIIFRDKKRNGWSQTLRYTMEYPNGERKDYYLLGRLSE